MPVNPITLDKLENVVIKNIEIRAVDRIVHEIKGTEIKKENKNKNSNNFNRREQEGYSKQFQYMLSKYNVDMEYKVLKNKVKIKIKDKKGNILVETEVEDVENILNRVKGCVGSIIDIKG